MTPTGRPADVILWTSRFDELHGQALVTRRLVEGQPRIRWRAAVYNPGRSGALRSVAAAAARLVRHALSFRRAPLYVVCSRSTAGFLRDLPALSWALAGRRVVVHCHGSDLPDLLFRRRVSPLARLLYRRCEIVVPSAHLLAPLVPLHARAVHLCENFWPGQGAAPGTRDPACRWTVAWNSNIMATKGVFALAEGLRLARARGLPFRLVLCGRPLPDAAMSEPEVAQALQALRREEWVDHRGPVPPEEAMRLAAQAGIVALPSRYASECQPLALVQAMCSERAILAADSPALRATLGDYPAAWLSDLGPEAVADALATLAQGWEDAITVRAQAGDLARRRFSPARFDARMEAILLTLTPHPDAGGFPRP